MRKFRVLFIMIFMVLSFEACSNQKENITEDEVINDLEDIDAAPSPSEEDSSIPYNDPETSDDDIPYEIVDTSFEQGDDIKIKYPQVTGMSDANKQDTINELIKQEAMKDVEEYKLEAGALEITYEIAWKGDNLLSIKYVVYSNFPGAAHPNHGFYTSNINMKDPGRVKLTDVVKITDYFVERFKNASVYVAPLEAGNKTESLLADDLNNIDAETLLNADSTEGYASNYSYFTEDSLGISIELPFVVGGYALYEVAYEDIISYIYHENEIWKDFPEILDKIKLSGNDETNKDTDDSDTNSSKESNPDNTYMDIIPVVAKGLLLGGYYGDEWISLTDTLPKLKGGETYQLFTADKYVGTAIGEAPELDIDFNLFYFLKMQDATEEYSIAVGSEKELLFKEPRKAEDTFYLSIVEDFFNEQGFDYQIENIEGFSIDLDGDMDEEHIITVYKYPENAYYMNVAEGHYAFTLCNDGNKTSVIEEAERSESDEYSVEVLGVEEGTELIILSIPSFAGAIDINKDGVCEVIITEGFFEGIGFGVYEYQKGTFQKVLMGGWGV
ncbi:MAG TPA: DUF4163 domain-containing protein [Mobilitalea sp.]|nr:DUF4163 domain-containing protein [Mobilitalea sp.]